MSATFAVAILAILLGGALILFLFRIFKTPANLKRAAQPAPQYGITLKESIARVIRMVAYASQRGILLDPKETQAIITAQNAGAKITPAQEAAFWASASSISKAILPVTIESIEASCFTATNTPSLAEDTARRYRIRTIVTLVALLFFQIYWLIGATLVSDLKDIKVQLEDLRTEFYRAQGVQYASNSNDRELSAKKTDSATEAANANRSRTESGAEGSSEGKTQSGADSSNVSKSKAELDLENWNDRLVLQRISASADFAMLKSWNWAGRLFSVGGQDDQGIVNPPQRTTVASTKTKNANSRNDGAQSNNDSNTPADTQDDEQKPHFLWIFNRENVGDMQTSQIILTALIKYILPILYGALGASAYIVRSLAAEIKDFTYDQGARMRYELRFYLGAVAGLSIAWFTSDTKSAETAGILQSLSPLALAFLAGYSVELLFSVLDRVVAAFSTPPAPGGQTRPAFAMQPAAVQTIRQRTQRAGRQRKKARR